MIDNIMNRISSIQSKMENINKKYSKFVSNKTKSGETKEKDVKKSSDKKTDATDAFKDILNKKKDIKSLIDTGLNTMNNNIFDNGNSNKNSSSLSNYFSNTLNSFIKDKKKD